MTIQKHDWQLLMHDYVIDNLLHGAALLGANNNKELRVLKKNKTEDAYLSAIKSTAKRATSYSVNTEGVVASRDFIKIGALECSRMNILKTNKMKLHKDTPIKVRTRYKKGSGSAIYFYEEIASIRYSSYGWRIEYKGITYGGSTSVEEHDALVLLQLGIPINESDKKETKKAYADAIAKLKKKV